MEDRKWWRAAVGLMFGALLAVVATVLAVAPHGVEAETPARVEIGTALVCDPEGCVER